MRVRQGVLAVVAALACAGGQAHAQVPQAPEQERVAQVGAVTIAKAEFDRWLATASHSRLGRAVEFAPPEYEDCVAARRELRKARRRGPLSSRELRARCRVDHRMLRRHVLQFLVQAQWVQQEAAAQGIVVGPRRVDRLFESQKREVFPDEREYRRFLRATGADEADIKFRIYLDALQNAVTRRVTARAKPVTARDVARYRAAHPRRFAGVDPAKANRRIRRLLASRREQMSLHRFIADFQARHRARTWCAPGYAIQECGALAPPAA